MKRLVALDMLRGYALVCIMLDHMPSSAARSVTLTHFAIFDAAELFVLLSGFLVGLVWQKVEQNKGRRAAQWRFIRRSFEVWRALVIGGVLLALLSAGLLALGLEHKAIWNQYAVWVIENPLGYAGTLATMWLQPNLLDVLAVYVVLIFSAPLLVPVLLRWPLIFALGSLVIWWFAPTLNGYLPNFDEDGFLFNPFGWQLLFYSGTAMALYRQGFMPVLLRHRRLITAIASAIIIYGAVYKLSPNFGGRGETVRDSLRLLYGTIDKWSLDEARYISIIAGSWLIAVPLANIMERIALSRPGTALQQIGRGGLWSFVICVFLSVTGDALQMNPSVQPVPERLAVDLLVIMALWWLAAKWLEYSTPKSKSRATPSQPRSTSNQLTAFTPPATISSGPVVREHIA